MAKIKEFRQSKDARAELTEEGKSLYRQFCPDTANLLKLEDKHVPLEDMYNLICRDLFTQIDMQKIIDMIDRQAYAYLRYLAYRNMIANDYLMRVAELLTAERQAETKALIAKLH